MRCHAWLGDLHRVALRSRFLALLCALLGSTGAPAASDVPPARFADPERRATLVRALPAIDALMADRLTEMGLPGLAYAVVVDDEVVLLRGIGKRNVSEASPVDGNTVFRIASMTKSFTALAVLKLRDAGRLSLDDPVARYVPEVRQWPMATADSGAITLRQLLGHTAGLPEDNPFGDRQLALSRPAFSDWLNAGVPFASGTGSEFEYSNLGFMLLGRVVTQASGRPFQAYVTDEILKPLGMHATYWRPADVPAQRLASGHGKQGDAFTPEPLLEDGAGAAMGGLMTTARDLSRYVAMMLSAWPPRDGPERAPALRRTLREMQMGLGFPSLYVGRTGPAARQLGFARSYGFGLESRVDCGWGREVRHSGGLPGFGSDMRWLPDRGVGVLAMANLTYAEAGRLTRDMLTLLQNTGALQPRQAQPAAALTRLARATADLLIDWQDERALALAADNLFLDESLAARSAAIAVQRADMGACKPGLLLAENALRGKQRVDCERGWLEATLTLAPTTPTRVQQLDIVRARTSAPQLEQVARNTAAAVAGGARDLRTAAQANRAELAAALDATRQVYGACALGELLEGDGVTNARYRLACERGPIDMSVALEQGELAKLTLAPPSDAVCAP